MVNLRYARLASAVLALVTLAACTNLQQGTVGNNQFWIKGPVAENDKAELGLAELAKGNNVGALAHFERALSANPTDVHALFGSALVYQNTGQPERARDFYKRILALDPQPSDEILVWAGSRPQAISDVANVNLTLLQGGRPAPLPDSADRAASSSMSSMRPESAELPTSKLYVPPVKPTLSVGRLEADNISFNDADNNIVARFKSIRFLLDEGLITQDEFNARRQANIGALLPLSKSAPAAGLGRSVPPGEQIAGRLRAIGRALEMRAITVQQHGSERGVILDSLMPAVPKSKAISPAPPSGLMEAADAVRRLELLRQINVITSDEYTAERAAIEGGRAPAPMASGPGAAQPMAMTAPSGAAAPMALSGFQPGVHLSSYRQRGAADRGWRELQKRFSALRDMQMMVERVDLGSTRGVFYRLKAGPVASNDAAKQLCGQLKAARQYCEPTTVDFGG